MEKFTKLIQQQRVRQGLTQKEVAEALGYSTAQNVSNWERGVCLPPVSKSAEICRLYGISRKRWKEWILQEKLRRFKNSF